jgi:cytidyltransferase-like protein
VSRQQIAVTGPFDDLRSNHLRFLEEAARLGDLTVFLWSDELIRQRDRQASKFPETERLYLLRAIRFVKEVILVNRLANDASLPARAGLKAVTWVVTEAQSNYAIAEFCRSHAINFHVVKEAELHAFPLEPGRVLSSHLSSKKVLVTGCYDWFHSGHVRFFEEVSAYGALYVVVGHDANIRQLKGKGHPLLHQDERRYMVASVRYVTQALVSSGQGWLDAEPEIALIKPDIYAVNEDGDRGGKREFCARHGIEYLVLKRRPAPGLPQRTSTKLRGF